MTYISGKNDANMQICKVEKCRDEKKVSPTYVLLCISPEEGTMLDTLEMLMMLPLLLSRTMLRATA